MDIYEHIDNMRPILADGDWDVLESEYYKLALKHAGDDYAERVKNLDFSAYQDALEESFSEAISLSKTTKASAIYFEFDLDNDWESAFYVCQDYNAESAEDDDWATEFDDDLIGPNFPEASKIYLENNFDGNPRACTVTLYLIARTLCAFGEFLEAYPLDIAICAGFHDQDALMRLREPKS